MSSGSTVQSPRPARQRIRYPSAPGDASHESSTVTASDAGAERWEGRDAGGADKECAVLGTRDTHVNPEDDGPQSMETLKR